MSQFFPLLLCFAGYVLLCSFRVKTLQVNMELTAAFLSFQLVELTVLFC